MEEKSLAMEMLQELKRSNKRWFVISIVELFIIVGMVIGYFIYDSQFEYDNQFYTQEVTDIESSTINQEIK